VDRVPHYFYGPQDTPMAREGDGTERAATANEILKHFPDTRRWPSSPTPTREPDTKNR
jgi:hypothetical protein